MLKQGVQLYKLKYIHKDSQYSVGILAMDWNDAEGYLRSQMGDIRIEERGGTFAVDAVTPVALFTQDTVDAEDSEVESISAPETTDDGRVVCPWCGKNYKSLKTLENHVKKEHITG